MNIVILADKYKKGYKNHGCMGLIKLNNSSTVLQHQYARLCGDFKNSTIYYVYGFDHKKFDASIGDNAYDNVKYIYNAYYDSLNEGFSLSMIKEFIKDDTIIVYGDHVFSKKAFINLDRKNSQVFIDRNNTSTIGCVLSNNSVTNIFYGLSNPIHNIFYIAKKHTEILQHELSKPKSHNMFLFEIINHCIDRGMSLNITNTMADSIIQYKPLTKEKIIK